MNLKGSLDERIVEYYYYHSSTSCNSFLLARFFVLSILMHNLVKSLTTFAALANNGVIDKY